MSKDNDDFDAELFMYYILLKCENTKRYFKYRYLKKLKAEYFCDDGSRTSVLLQRLIKKKMLYFDTRKYLYRTRG